MRQRVFQIAAGYEDCNDCNDLREDMIFKMCAGRLPQSGNDLASQPTMSRLENTVKKTDLFRLGECLVQKPDGLVLRQIWGCFNLIETISLSSATTQSWPVHAFAA